MCERNPIIDAIRVLLWGRNDRMDVFKRWTQGFRFSASENSALEQYCGGPCCVLAPVQAYILKYLIADTQTESDLQQVSSDRCLDYLQSALLEILDNCAETQTKRTYYLTTLPDTFYQTDEGAHDEFSLIDSSHFHRSLKVEIFESAEAVREFVKSNFKMFTSNFGVLCFLYSAILTKGIENMKNELLDVNDPLIHEVHGSGSQSLINLMLTGQSVSDVFDNEEVIESLTLKGISKQSKIGYLTLMEYLRHVTVGSYYKNPVHPIWVMGSETHLTVLFSFDRRLVAGETVTEKAQRIFKQYDTDNNNFIKAEHLADVLEKLNLVHEPDYVEFMRGKMDEENLGIILLDQFINTFFSKYERSVPDSFTLYHYNGLKQSNPSNEVKYSLGNAVILETNIEGGMHCSSRPLLTCIQTKWPTIEINWCTDREPSLN